MSKSPKHLIWAFLASAIVLAVFAVWTSQAVADQLTSEDITPETKTPEFPEIKEAFDRFIARDTAGAKKILEEAVKAHPELPPMEVIMAQFFAAVRQPKGIRPWLQKAVTEHPTDPEAYVMLGRLDAQIGLTIEAWLLLEKANSLLAESKLDEKRKKGMQAAINSQLAKLAMSRKSWEEAKKYLYGLLDEQPANATALQLLARVFFEEGKTDQALEKLLTAQAAAQANDKKMLTPQAVLAQWYEAKDDRRNAIKLMKEALTIAPKDFDTRLAAAAWAFRIKKFDEAQKQADAAVKLKPESINALLMAGNIAIFLKDYPTAEKHLRKAWAKAPSNFKVSNNLSLVLCEQDDKDKLSLAQNLANININDKMNQKNPEAFSTFGRVLYKSDRLKEAEQSLSKAASIARNNGKGISPDTAYYIAVIYADTKRNEEAKKLLQGALKAKGLFSQRDAAEALLARLSK